MQIPHIPVLYTETIDVFKDIENGYIIDVIKLKYEDSPIR